eukprot:scaffold3340_cov255-Pinguiococcus_pyrenoidosus.AAC.25
MNAFSTLDRKGSSGSCRSPCDQDRPGQAVSRLNRLGQTDIGCLQRMAPTCVSQILPDRILDGSKSSS